MSVVHHKLRMVKMAGGEMFIGKQVQDPLTGSPMVLTEGYLVLEDVRFIHAQVADNGEMRTALLPWVATKLKLQVKDIPIQTEREDDIPHTLARQYQQATSNIQIASAMPPMRQ